MKNNLGLNLIYNSVAIAPHQGQESGPFFKVLYLFSEAGFIQNKTQTDIVKTLFQGQLEGQLYFKSLEDLGRFALHVCQELKAPEVFVVSAEDYNSAVEATRDIRNFRDIYRRFGHSILNPDFKKEKSSLFGKFFKE
jgi:hypothetical protein